MISMASMNSSTELNYWVFLSICCNALRFCGFLFSVFIYIAEPEKYRSVIKKDVKGGGGGEDGSFLTTDLELLLRDC